MNKIFYSLSAMCFLISTIIFVTYYFSTPNPNPVLNHTMPFFCHAVSFLVSGFVFLWAGLIKGFLIRDLEVLERCVIFTVSK